MTLLAQRVARRFNFTILSDDRFRPPKWLAEGVEVGEIPTKGLLIWKYVVESIVEKTPKISSGDMFKGGVAYWRHKCKKEGIDLLPKHLSGGEGATFGSFKIKTGDDIEDWVKERLRSERLWEEGIKTADEWQLDITHLRRVVEDATGRITLHEKGIAEGSRVKQRIQWMAGAKTDLARAGKDLDAAEKALEAFKVEVVRHEEAKAPAIDFEKQFQSALHAATMDLSKRDVLAQAKAALAKFEAEMAQQPKMAADGIMDAISGLLNRAWNWVVSAFDDLREWVSDLTSSTKRISKLLDAAGA